MRNNPPPTPFLLSACLLLLASSAATQTLIMPMATRPLVVDSGHLDNPSKTPEVVFSGLVTADDAAWFRMFFENTHLPPGSRLRLTSKDDGAVQYFDGRSLQEYGNSSAYFNGTEVEIELIAGPGTRANRVRVHSVELSSGVPDGPDSICGSRDDRILSSDPRIGRGISGVSGCTWWPINEFTILTAGHCASGSSSTWIIGFNLPLSSSGGSTRQPPPDDQYAVPRSTLRRLSSGTGADWAVVSAVRNSNHGFYPGQRQGWFRLGKVPSQISGVTIRITGNGSVSSPVSPTWNYVPKTHTGPRVSTSTRNAISYRTDTTGGNSGSPVINEATGEAIGIHTHGGCNRSGGKNSGTRIDRSDLVSAINAVRNSKVAGSYSSFGTGCGGTAGTPDISLAGIPDVGGSTTVSMSSLPSQQPGVLAIGTSNVIWTGVNLPLGLGSSGLTGCTLFVSLDSMVAFDTGTGSAEFDFVVPASPALIGNRAYFQAFALDPGAARAIGAVISNAGEIFVGG